MVESDGGHTCIACIMGFVTFKNQEITETAPEELTGCIDPTLYAVLHCQTTYFQYSRLQRSFIRKFEMMKADSMYILPAHCITGPLIVIPNIESKDSMSSVNYMALVSRHKMGGHFLHYSKRLLAQLQGQEEEEDEEKYLYADTWDIV
jgi:hypothetical protein